MLKINDNRNKIIRKESICLLLILIFFAYVGLSSPEIYEDTRIKLCMVILGIVFVYEFFMLLFRWKIITLTQEGILEEYYSILQKKPYKVKQIVLWKKVKSVHLIKRSKMGKAQPCLVMAVFFNIKGQRDTYFINTEGMYFFNYKGQEYDPMVVDCLNEINKMYPFKVVYE